MESRSRMDTPQCGGSTVGTYPWSWSLDFLSWVSVVWLQIVALGAHAYRLMGRDMLHIERKGRRLPLWKLKEHVRSPDEAENLGIVMKSAGYGIDYQ